ncbi:TPA: hypothetical protein O1J55_004680 [Escherichia coli]|jgi:hypothetical protein|uniref:hypothetical protein n=1 Tax=Enterobacteriaceae TaxID=543 RepID=UPI0015DDA38A|nr:MULTISPECIES: hypothetical protein [Enterobacteriaceae]MBA0065290.1 hypothetical protein [Klebsiella pneumoniae]MBL4465930.1 hypothetical protein [Klebsiella pneumoniae]MDP0793974.1 hypothetical protein [Klebsiella pneumoniae]MDS6654357.1 hypothetical protein [Klebsiella pneumoniae]MDX4464709.1 hypothetical protein [Klebsiella pneumoniae]
MTKYIATYSASAEGVEIYSGSLFVEVESVADDTIKQAVTEQLAAINKNYGGGTPDTVAVNSYSEATS